MLPLLVTLVSTACPVPASAGVECFTLTVPENRTKSSSKTISIPVVRFKTKAAHPAEPLAFLVGGPGASSLRDRLDASRNQLVAERDVILFEQRGTRLSSPELDCPERPAALETIARQNLGGAAAIAKERAVAASCGKRLVDAGIDLDGYDTAEIAQDLLDLQKALAIPKLDVYAISYGTRVVLEAMRRSPASFHAVVLDSVLPPDVRYDEMATENALSALHRLLDACAVEPACAKKYPDLEARWQAALVRANKTPIAATLPLTPPASIRVTARNMIDAVYDAMYDRGALRGVPKLVDAIARGELAPMLKILADNAGPAGLMRGQRLSVWCREEAAITDMAKAPRHPELGDWQTITAAPEVCKAWPVTVGHFDTTPVAVDVPTLIFAGEFDPVIAPAWGRRVRATLPNGYFVELPGATHGAAETACSNDVMHAFLRDPRRLPDLACVTRMPSVVFD